MHWLMVPPAARSPAEAERSRWATPNATSFAASARPSNVNFSNNERGDRVAVVTFSQGTRAGIYTFTGGRLSSIERGPEPVAQPRAAKPKPKKKPAAT